MTVAELIKELEQLDSDQRIIVSVKENREDPFLSDFNFDLYYKGDIQDITFHMDGNGNNAYALEVENSFVEYVRRIKE